MGTNSPKLADTNDSWFFIRHGQRVKDRSRYQLNYRNPKVRAYADQVIAQLVDEYGVGYIKMDYNINAGMGTEVDADSFCDALLEHSRAYLQVLIPNRLRKRRERKGRRINSTLSMAD